MKYASKRQEAQTRVAGAIFRRMHATDVRVEESFGEIYLHGEHAFGKIAMVVAKRGKIEWLTLPEELKRWK
jgi:hypothetical protein